MTAPNGHARAGAAASANGAEADRISNVLQTFDQPHRFGAADINRYAAELEIPFDPCVIEWRVTNSNRDKSRGQVIPYADQRAYTDRLNALFTPAGWTRKYAIHTSANFQRSRDQKLVTKVLVTCELSIFGFGSHSATGEGWADDDNAGTSAEAQAFKRACSCFGLGRYLYYFTGMWVDLDERKRPTNVPQLFAWATPQGWREGLRPKNSVQVNSNGKNGQPSAIRPQSESLTAEIEAMADPLGRGLYRGILRDLARVWNPREIRDISVQQKVLEYMRAAERGLRRLEAALGETGPETLVAVLKTFGLNSLERVDTLEMLKRVVLELEGSRQKSQM
jgi:hypothetical protein